MLRACIYLGGQNATYQTVLDIEKYNYWFEGKPKSLTIDGQQGFVLQTFFTHFPIYCN